MRPHVVTGWWKDTGRREDMLDANRLVLDTIESRCDGTLEEDVVLEGRVIVEEGAVLARCLVRGPVIIGKRARIADAFIGPYTSISDDAVIEHAEIEYSIILERAPRREPRRAHGELARGTRRADHPQRPEAPRAPLHGRRQLADLGAYERPDRARADRGRPGRGAAEVHGRARLVLRAAARELVHRAVRRPAVAADQHLVLTRGRHPRPALASPRPGRPLLLPVGSARVVLLDRREDSPTADVAWSIDIDEDNCRAVYVPGQVAHGFEALTDLVFCYHVTEEYDPADPDEQNVRWDDARVVHLWSTTTPRVSARDA